MPEVGLYQTALQHPDRCFLDEELKTATVEKNAGGWMPLAWAGQFAVVFKLRTSKGFKAVRCFYHPQTEHEERYKLLHQHVQLHSPDCFIGFEYLKEGILLNGTYFPIVKMDWAEGETLDKRIQGLVQSRDVNKLEKLSNTWCETALSLSQASIAHGDMQHANILSQNGSLHLVDYDGVFIPPFQGRKALEAGHRNYQHPGRSRSASFGLYIDHFSAFVIYLSLKALAANPGLWNTYHQDNCLILQQDDYLSPQKSAALKSLKSSSETQVRELAGKLEQLCAWQVENLPSFEKLVGIQTGTKSTVPIAPIPNAPVGRAASGAPDSQKAWWESVPVPVTGNAPQQQSPVVPQRPASTPPPPPANQGWKSFGQIALVLFILFAVICLLLIFANGY